jgi:hypothetical protein
LENFKTPVFVQNIRKRPGRVIAVAVVLIAVSIFFAMREPSQDNRVRDFLTMLYTADAEQYTPEKSYAAGQAEKYRHLFTAKAFDRFVAEELPLLNQIHAHEMGASLFPGEIRFEKRTAVSNAITYLYTLDLIIRHPDGSETQIPQQGAVVIDKNRGGWLIESFQIPPAVLEK